MKNANKYCGLKWIAVNSLFAVIVLNSFALQAALLNQWGVSRTVINATCESTPCTSEINAGIGSETVLFGQLATGFISQTTIHGTASGSAALSITAGLNMPTLRGKAEANVAQVKRIVLRAVDAYTYIGTSQSTIDFTAFLTGSVSNPNLAGVRESEISADIFLMDADLAETTFGNGMTAGDSVLLANSLSHPESSHTQMVLRDGSLPIAAGGFSVTLEPGDTFYLWANMVVSAGDEGISDALNTLNMSFSDTSQLVSASATAVPLPGGLVLLVSGLIGLLAAGKKTSQ